MIALYLILLPLVAQCSWCAPTGTERSAHAAGPHGFEWQNGPSAQAWSPNPFEVSSSSPPQAPQDGQLKHVGHAEWLPSVLDTSSRTLRDAVIVHSGPVVLPGVVQHEPDWYQVWPRQPSDDSVTSPLRLSSPQAPSVDLATSENPHLFSPVRLHHVYPGIERSMSAGHPAAGQVSRALDSGNTEPQPLPGQPPHFPISAPTLPSPYAEWADGIRRTLNDPYLRFTSVDQRSLSSPRVFVAHVNTRDLHAVSYSPTYPMPLASPIQATSFMRRVNAPRIKMGELAFSPSRSRTFVYLSSQQNMHDLNQRYFLNRLHFIPIDPMHLDYRGLYRIFWDRKELSMLPPVESSGLGLLVARHEGGSERMDFITQAARGLGNRKQIVSLWSPVLRDGRRTTVVLYGFGWLDPKEGSDVIEHLKGLIRGWKGMDRAVVDVRTGLERVPGGLAPF